MIWKLFHELFGTFNFPIYVNVGEKVKCTPWNNLALETNYWHPLALNKDNFLTRETSWSDHSTITTKLQSAPAKQPLYFNCLQIFRLLANQKYLFFNSCQHGLKKFGTIITIRYNCRSLSHIFTAKMSNSGDNYLEENARRIQNNNVIQVSGSKEKGILILLCIAFIF